MEARGRVGLKSAAIATLAFLLPPTASAYAHAGGAGLSFLNQFFLPAGTQVSGFTGLLYGILAPFGIVTIILYVGLRQVLPGNRQAQGLAVLLALFIIPSGGYKVISNALLTVFGLGAGGAVSQLTLPFIGRVEVVDALMSFFVFAWLLGSQIIGRDQFQFWEYTASAVGAFLVWVAIGGGIGVVEAAGWVFFLWIAYEIFESGMEARRREGFMVGLIGLFLFFFVLSRASILPDQLQGLAGIVSGLGVLAFFAVLAIILAVLIIIYDAASAGPPSGWNPVTW
ncbi:MAG: hypothetical protein ABEI97_01180 [Candidatus Nanohaloarchaea archaeon]